MNRKWTDIEIIIDGTYPSSFWLQRLSPSTLVRDCAVEFQMHTRERGRPLWRCKIGRDSEWVYGDNVLDVINGAMAQIQKKDNTQ